MLSQTKSWRSETPQGAERRYSLAPTCCFKMFEEDLIFLRQKIIEYRGKGEIPLLRIHDISFYETFTTLSLPVPVLILNRSTFLLLPA